MKPFLTPANRWPFGYERLHVYLTLEDALDTRQHDALATALRELARHSWLDVIPLGQLHVTIQMASDVWLHELADDSLESFSQASRLLAARTPPLTLQVESPVLGLNSVRSFCGTTPRALAAIRTEVSEIMRVTLGPTTDRYPGGHFHVTLAYSNREIDIGAVPIHLPPLAPLPITSIAVVAGAHHPTENWVTWRALARFRLGS